GARGPPLPPPPPAPLPTPPDPREISLAVSRLADDLVASYPEADLSLAEGPCIVATFVELDRLDHTSSFGRILAEQLMGALQRRGLTPVELRKTTSVLVRDDGGELGLSRRLAELDGAVQAGTLLAGTYLATADGVFVHVRLVDMRDATVLASAEAVFPHNSLVDDLLHTRSVTPAPQPGNIYMKRLVF
ncbi:MAG: FlgO family outer membrane protein, partial [Thermodesulfobacteriota bacterium]